MKEELDHCLRHGESVVVEELDADVCLYLSDTNDVAVLNRTAGDIWALVDGQTSSWDIATQLATAYGAEPETIAADVDRVLDDLAQRGFLGRV